MRKPCMHGHSTVETEGQQIVEGPENNVDVSRHVYQR